MKRESDGLTGRAAKEWLDALETHRSLVERAVVIVRDAPYFRYVPESEWATISIDGDRAVLSWPETDSSYDSCSIERNYTEFPAELLSLNDRDLAAWKAEQQKIYDEKQNAIDAQGRFIAAQRERALFLALKAKYEPQ